MKDLCGRELVDVSNQPIEAEIQAPLLGVYNIKSLAGRKFTNDLVGVTGICHRGGGDCMRCVFGFRPCSPLSHEFPGRTARRAKTIKAVHPARVRARKGCPAPEALLILECFHIAVETRETTIISLFVRIDRRHECPQKSYRRRNAARLAFPESPFLFSRRPHEYSTPRRVPGANSQKRFPETYSLTLKALSGK